MKKSATISPCGRYRYELTRTWDPCGRLVVWIMLNPSTADAEQDDATIRKCVTLSRAWGFGRLTVVNLFAWRATDRRQLRLVDRPSGGEANEKAIVENARLADAVVCAWGKDGRLHGRDARALWLLRGAGVREIFHLGLNDDATPKHPLYLANATQPVKWASEIAR
jgi:hypothetical protein